MARIWLIVMYSTDEANMLDQMRIKDQVKAALHEMYGNTVMELTV